MLQGVIHQGDSTADNGTPRITFAFGTIPGLRAVLGLLLMRRVRQVNRHKRH